MQDIFNLLNLLSNWILFRTICTSSLDKSFLFLLRKSSNLPESIAEKYSIAFWYKDNRLFMFSIDKSSFMMSSYIAIKSSVSSIKNYH